MIEEVKAQTEESMKKTISGFENELASVRTGRASALLLDKITVSYYGSMMPINQVAAIKTPEAHMLVIEPWDKGIVKDIEKAILASDLGITPSSDGAIIRLPFPAPTEERRRELVKQCKNTSENFKNTIRGIRRDANTKVEKAKKDSEISEDDMKRAQADIQKLTDTYIAKIDERMKAKEAEIMEI